MKFRHESSNRNKRKEAQILAHRNSHSYFEHQKDSIPFYCSGLGS